MAAHRKPVTVVIPFGETVTARQEKEFPISLAILQIGRVC
jgi:hypothetical protein